MSGRITCFCTSITGDRLIGFRIRLQNPVTLIPCLFVGPLRTALILVKRSPRHLTLSGVPLPPTPLASPEGPGPARLRVHTTLLLESTTRQGTGTPRFPRALLSATTTRWSGHVQPLEPVPPKVGLSQLVSKLPARHFSPDLLKTPQADSSFALFTSTR